MELKYIHILQASIFENSKKSEMEEAISFVAWDVSSPLLLIQYQDTV